MLWEDWAALKAVRLVCEKYPQSAVRKLRVMLFWLDGRSIGNLSRLRSIIFSSMPSEVPQFPFRVVAGGI